MTEGALAGQSTQKSIQMVALQDKIAKGLNVGLRPTTHRDGSLTGEVNSPCSLIPHAASPRTALRAMILLNSLHNNLLFVIVLAN